jgi:hypothetical protein
MVHFAPSQSTLPCKVELKAQIGRVRSTVFIWVADVEMPRVFVKQPVTEPMAMPAVSPLYWTLEWQAVVLDYTRPFESKLISAKVYCVQPRCVSSSSNNGFSWRTFPVNSDHIPFRGSASDIVSTRNRL